MRRLDKRAVKANQLWIPGYHGVAGSEEADACAKQAEEKTDGVPQSVSFAAASEQICRTLMDLRPSHCRKKRPTPRRFNGQPTVGREAILLARLRSGHTLIKANSNQLNTAVDPKYPSCCCCYCC